MLGIVCAIILGSWLIILARRRRAQSQLASIPTIGPDGLLMSYLGAFRWLTSARAIMQEGYDKYKGQIFKVANLNHWLIVVSGPHLIEELRQAPDDELSFSEGINEDLAINYNLGPEIHHDPYHIPLLRNQLTKSLGTLFPAVRDEIVQAFEECIPPTSEWSKVEITKTMMQIVCRTSNRVFVGKPLCRNTDWIALNVEFTIDVTKAAAIINLFPMFFRPLAGRLFTNVHSQSKRGTKHLAPIIKDRKLHIEEYGSDWEDKPVDMLSWLMDERPSGIESSAWNLTRRILTVNFAAIHTSSMTFNHALYHLAAMPEYIQPMREEAENIIGKEGWTKAAMGKLHRVDSFLKETMRFTGINCANMSRKVLKDFTFSNGTTVPKGSRVCVATSAMHNDIANYPNPDVFDGFRFSEMRASEGESVKHQLVATNLDYVAFGHGRHACPGRFFAANELKAMLAHLVITYDVKLENEGVRPPDFCFAENCMPNRTGEVLFRKRRI